MLTYLNSLRIQSIDPVDSYLYATAAQWDGHDYIADVAARVKTDLPQWTQWFRLWFLGMVAQWMGYNGRRWFDDADIEAVMAHNRMYALLSSADIYFNEYFVVTTKDDPDALCLTAASIFDYIRRRAGAGVITESLTNFSRYLSNVPGIEKAHSRTGNIYYVKYST